MIKNFIITFFLIGFIYNIPIATNKSLDNEIIIQNDSISYIIDSLKSELTNKISDYIPENSKVDPRLVIDICYKHKFDIPLLMSQAQWESHWGTRGRAVKTNSIFGLGAWDNETKKGYEHVNDCIEDYVLHIKNNYQQNKTVEQLLTNFVHKNGYRYSSNPEYEKFISGTRNRIIRKSDIYNLQIELYNI